ncbi:MAG TPA: RHS repeat-associated core domain-containing protein [Solirubrobacteraceae bacterium]|nr:RHS repeat-associated core domain-containing protein [Solirubrobacteraceae bacterium]
MKISWALSTALTALCVAAATATPAFGLAEWLLEGASIPASSKAHVESTGTILLRDIKEKSQIECHLAGLWAVWEHFGEMTEATISTCKTTEGPCSSPTASALDTPWLSELTSVGTEVKNSLLADGKGEPGWQVKCLVIGIELTDTCKGEASAPLVENTAEKDVLFIFNQAGVASCTLGGASQGEIKGEVLVVDTEGLALSVAGAGESHEFLSSEGLGPNEGAPALESCSEASVICATGDLTERQTDIAVAGRGPNLDVIRTYNSLLAASESESERGPFGYGWTEPFGASLTINEGAGTATVRQADGSSVVFYLKEGKYAPGSWVEAKLVKEGTNYIYTMPDQTKLEFNSSGQLTSETDRNGNALTMTYNASKELESVKDGAGRKLTFVYNAEKLVESIKDPMGHTAKYTYAAGNLASVTLPGEEKARWKFEYNVSHEITLMTDGRGNSVLFEYEASNRVSVVLDPLEREHKFTYKTVEGGTETTITEPNGSKTVDTFNVADEPLKVIRASGTELAATTSYQYNLFLLTLKTDPDEHSTEYAYDSEDNRISEKDANSNESKKKYNATHDVETETTPKGETTTIKYTAHGDPETVERTVGAKVEKTTYKYDEHGDMTEEIDPLEAKSKFEYDTYGDREATIDPEGDKRTWKFNEDSQETSEVSPRGNVSGGEPLKFTTTTERDEQGRVLKVTDPLAHHSEFTYNGDGEVESVTDGDGHKTTYAYNADGERTEVKEPKSTTKTGYDSEGAVTSQTDGNLHTTEYKRNALEEITEEIDPLLRKTKKKYDAVGNLKEVEDAEGRITTYKYDPGNRATEIVYSEGTKPTVKYEYDKDGHVTKMIDSTGETTYTYDEADRLTETKDAHGDKVKYEYNLDDELTKITYPNGESVTRGYDKAGRLNEIKDWLGNVTKFTYSADSELEHTVFPAESGNEDKYFYDEADQMSEVKMLKGAETLASLVYTRDKVGVLEKTVSKGLPGAETTEYVNDEDNRLTKAGATAYEYDAADQATKIAGAAYTYDASGQIEKGGETTYTYDKVGGRTKAKRAGIPETTYEYNQAGVLTGIKRAHEGETSEINDSFTYDGNKLRMSQTINGTTSHLAWDPSESTPLLLSDETNNYIYGPSGIPVEQISSSGTVLYLHHDQQGSTRLLTGTTGKNEGAYTYGPYGATEGHTGTAVTPLGYDGQYRNEDTGFIYLRAREYDPASDQFLEVDPDVAETHQRYSYADDSPLNAGDPSGLSTNGGCVQLFFNLPNFMGGGMWCRISDGRRWGSTLSVSGSIGYTEQLKNMLINVAQESSAARTLGSGISGGVRGAYQWTNANNIPELDGPSEIWQVSVGWGFGWVGISGAYSEGRKPGGGISRTVGLGASLSLPSAGPNRSYGGGLARTWVL